jgi:hypothetical protein
MTILERKIAAVDKKIELLNKKHTNGKTLFKVKHHCMLPIKTVSYDGALSYLEELKTILITRKANTKGIIVYV